MGQGYYQPGYQQPNMMGQPNMMMGQPGFQQPGFQQPGFQQPNMIVQPVPQQMNMGVNPYQQQQMQQMQQMNMMNNMNNMNVINQNGKKKKDGFARLEERGGIFIKQRFDWEEAFSGCEQENVYYVYGLTKDGEKKGNLLFKCKEKSSCCARMCLSGECRPFVVTVSTVDKDFEELDNEPFIKIERPCKCTCYCFNRPEITVTHVSGGKDEYIGKVVDPFQLCNLVLNVYSKDHGHKYTVDGSCCQLGIWCKCPCEPCQEINFDIKGADGTRLSELKKKSAGCLKAAMSDADNFSLVFPADATKEDKAVLLAATLFLDFRHFEENPQQQKKGQPIIIQGGDE